MNTKTESEERLIRALLNETNGQHSIAVKMALRAVRAERSLNLEYPNDQR